MTLPAVSALTPYAARSGEVAPAAGTDDDFGNILGDAIQKARGAETTAVANADAFGRGDPDIGIHEVMISAEKANIALRYAVTLKNRVIEAYRELMNTPL